jgi:threonine/homoserine/homoserine lactone efflux protein
LTLILTPTSCLALDVRVDPIVSLFSILGALFLGAISPGPSFLYVARTAVAVSRRSGIASAIGMGLGASLVCALAMLGVRALFTRAEWLYVSFKLLGGIYLCYLAWRLWRSGKGDATVSAETLPALKKTGVARSIWLALATQLSNPKTLVVISGIFAALLPSRIPAWMYWAIPLIQLFVETSWYAFVAVALSSRGPRLIYLGAKGIIDRTAGGVLGVLGLRLIFEGAKEVA